MKIIFCEIKDFNKKRMACIAERIWKLSYDQKFSRWANNRVMQRIFTALQTEEIIVIQVEVLALDSISCKVHLDAHRALKTNSANKPLQNQREIGIPSFIWYPLMTRSSLKYISLPENATTDPKGVSQQ